MSSPAGRHTDVLSFAFEGSADYDEHRPLYIDAKNPASCLNASQLRRLVRTLIAGLRCYIKRGDCVMIHLENNYVYSALYFAIIGAGGVYIGASPDSSPHEIMSFLDLGEPKLIITSNRTLQAILDISSSKGFSSKQVCLFDEPTISNFLQSNPNDPSDAAHLTIDHLLSHGEGDWNRIDDESLSKTTPAAIYCTSGTSGLPKAAVLSHYAIISQHLNIHYEVPYHVRRLLVVPMYHRFGALWHTFPIRQGEPAYLLPKFDVVQFLKAAHRHQITDTYIVPAMVHILNLTTQPAKELLSSMRLVDVAGAPIDTASMHKFQTLLHKDGTVSQSWGMTETGPVFLNKYGEPHDKASIGKLVGTNEVKLLDDHDNIISDDESPGELCIRGSGLLTTYQRRSDGKDEQGWFRTGDVAYRNNGSYFLFGRTKEIIKVRGYQVAPAEIESVLLTHPDITDAAVLGVQSSDKTTEVPRAYVVRSQSPSGTKISIDEIYRFAQARLAGYKALDGGVVFVTDIPRTASGKIQRAKLGQMNAQRDRIAQILSRRVTEVVV
ncbi:adenylate-forming enzyme AfeA [Aspergillus heteromorphus CBS 117.55]|uniref:Adenylate-forming enzyme AfeA n=1 Tax=Aspergillus heteromorphus CBS 117.55 TaxID=1448321 RepID=A0A317W756_9EURO|nr:adenylate-forming enzyme AfeA [Aspergillus heteromorphus CBS 117.55]PWY82223.1 adenylate-forming enzyme AfeA [Aspergillus heteromorphus CBS 117.55]